MSLLVYLSFVIPQEESRRLEFAMWLVAWDKDAPEAQTVYHQLDSRQCLLHKEVVLGVACAASSGGRSDVLGI